MKEVLSLSGIDISQFSDHSTRSTSTSIAFKLRVPISDIMKVADWSQASTFKKFYQKPIKDSYERKILPYGITVEIRNYGNSRMLCKITTVLLQVNTFTQFLNYEGRETSLIEDAPLYRRFHKQTFENST